MNLRRGRTAGKGRGGKREVEEEGEGKREAGKRAGRRGSRVTIEAPPHQLAIKASAETKHQFRRNLQRVNIPRRPTLHNQSHNTGGTENPYLPTNLAKYNHETNQENLPSAGKSDMGGSN